jgi:HSP20 family protein
MTPITHPEEPAMNMVRRTSPLNDLASFRSAFDRLFDEGAFRPLAWSGYERHMPLDVSSTEDAITIDAALPGVRSEDIEITAHQDTLTIAVRESAERESSEGQRVYREVRRGRGSRTLTLPSGLDLDAATASFENGMLHLSIPRAEQAKPRQIAVTAVTDGTQPPVTTSTQDESGSASEG